MKPQRKKNSVKDWGKEKKKRKQTHLNFDMLIRRKEGKIWEKKGKQINITMINEIIIIIIKKKKIIEDTNKENVWKLMKEL